MAGRGAGVTTKGPSRSVEQGSLEEHELVVKGCLEELALMGFAAWENPRRAVKVNGRWVSLTKSGRGDIQVILPRRFGELLLGIHSEVECKTGQSTQSPKQRAHMRMVRNSGGVYILTKSRERMRADILAAGFESRL